jgi:hypothetical protein
MNHITGIGEGTEHLPATPNRVTVQSVVIQTAGAIDVWPFDARGEVACGSTEPWVRAKYFPKADHCSILENVIKQSWIEDPGVIIIANPSLKLQTFVSEEEFAKFLVSHTIDVYAGETLLSEVPPGMHIQLYGCKDVRIKGTSCVRIGVFPK